MVTRIATRMARLVLLTLGLMVISLGSARMLAADLEIMPCLFFLDGNVCAAGETCIFGVCFDWQRHYPNEDWAPPNACRQWGICSERCPCD